VGSVLGALIGTGIPERNATILEQPLKGGNILLSTTTHSEMQTKYIMDILKQHGAQNISISTSERVSNVNE
jgi:S-adenosylhomocysteine hydrolase